MKYTTCPMNKTASSMKGTLCKLLHTLPRFVDAEEICQFSPSLVLIRVVLFPAKEADGRPTVQAHNLRLSRTQMALAPMPPKKEI